MKRILLSIVAAAAIALAAPAQSLGDAIGGLITAVTNTSNFEVSDLVGTWDYQSPAVSFKSDNALAKVGGAGASIALEAKMKPYYEQLGINTLQLTVDSEANFTMKMRQVTLKGTVAKDDDRGQLTFNFAAFGKVKLGSLSANAVKSANGVLTLTFDVSRMVTIVDKVSQVAKLSSVQALVSLLKSYEGIYAGAELKRTSKTDPAAGTAATTGTAAATDTATAAKPTVGSVLKGIGSAVSSRKNGK